MSSLRFDDWQFIYFSELLYSDFCHHWMHRCSGNCLRVILYILFFMIMPYSCGFYVDETFCVIRGWFRSLFCINLKFLFSWKLGLYFFLLSLDSFLLFERPASLPFPCRSLWWGFLPLLGGGGESMPSSFAFSWFPYDHVVVFFSCLLRTQRDFIDNGLGSSSCFRGNVMSCHITLSSFCRRNQCGIHFTSFSGMIFGRFVLAFQWFCWPTRVNVLAPLHVVEVRMVFRRAGLISFGR